MSRTRADSISGTDPGCDRREFLGTAAGVGVSVGMTTQPEVGSEPWLARARTGDEISSLFDLSGMVAVLADLELAGSAEIALTLARAGAAVVLANSDHAASRRLADSIAAVELQAVAIPADVESEKDVVKLFGETLDRLGSVDILVNCGGLSASPPLTETTAEQWDRLQSCNLRSQFLCMREAVKAMIQGRRGGRIVNVTTVGAVHPVLHGNQAYASARAGVAMLSKSAALDYAPEGIRVNVVMPGPIPGRVSRMATASQAQGGPISDGPHRLPLGQGSMRDLAAAVLFLVSPASAYVTGQTIALDGGFLLT
jgi:NAD(P)-dependent dehydrogenase (short-subunit alcohol dehydrogenase family)